VGRGDAYKKGGGKNPDAMLRTDSGQTASNMKGKRGEMGVAEKKTHGKKKRL